ncbi:hypothetical protein QFZ77_003197 [Paenibacillus sp. V4I3]|nr:hypothetical protein [Paenibacillus sp. V4I3]MDQ0889701.1 hypothetical protein [Paenibacillus sp. V4I9]
MNDKSLLFNQTSEILHPEFDGEIKLLSEIQTFAMPTMVL